MIGPLLQLSMKPTCPVCGGCLQESPCRPGFCILCGAEIKKRSTRSLKMSNPLKATHEGKIRIGKIELECHVLENGKHVFSARDILDLFDQHDEEKTPHQLLTSFLRRIEVHSIANNDDLYRLLKPIKFIKKDVGGFPMNGFDADLLPEICNTVLKLQTERWLPEDMREAARRSRILMNSFAKVGVIALIDEATGYQEVRDKNALQQILDKYLRREYAQWAKRFPDEFYKELFRLKGWEWRGMKVNRPTVVGTYTRDIVYSRLAPGVLKELERLNPVLESGQRRVRHHQWFTEDIGHPALNQHIGGVLAIMRLSSDWAQFKRQLTRVYPKIGEQHLLPIEEEEIKPSKQ